MTSATAHIRPAMTVTVQVLPRCHSCGGAHPLARRPASAQRDCPDCGAPVRFGASKEVAAEISGWGPSAILARFCMWLASKAADLARRMNP